MDSDQQGADTEHATVVEWTFRDGEPHRGITTGRLIQQPWGEADGAAEADGETRLAGERAEPEADGETYPLGDGASDGSGETLGDGEADWWAGTPDREGPTEWASDEPYGGESWARRWPADTPRGTRPGRCTEPGPREQRDWAGRSQRWSGSGPGVVRARLALRGAQRRAGWPRCVYCGGAVSPRIAARVQPGITVTVVSDDSTREATALHPACRRRAERRRAVDSLGAAFPVAAELVRPVLSELGTLTHVVAGDVTTAVVGGPIQDVQAAAARTWAYVQHWARRSRSSAGSR